jgi:hypothetical protein
LPIWAVSIELKNEQSAGQMRTPRRRILSLPLNHHAHAHLNDPKLFDLVLASGCNRRSMV